jgi:hypothetical protein
MSVSVMAAVWTLDLPPREKLVLLALADCANDEGRCWPSASTLARKTGEGERTVRRAVQSLIRKKVLHQHQRSGTSPIYTVTPCQSGTRANAAPLPGRPSPPAGAAPKTSGTVKGSEAHASSPRAKFSAPEGVSADQWDAFRKQRKKPLNERSYALLSNKLRVLAENGYPPGEMVDLAIERGWETVFEPRTFSNARPSNPTATALARVRAALGNGRSDNGADEDAGFGSACDDERGSANALARFGG